MSATELRIILVILGAIAIALIYIFGRPKKPGQGKRMPFLRSNGARIEPTLGESDSEEEPDQGELDMGQLDDGDLTAGVFAERGRNQGELDMGPISALDGDGERKTAFNADGSSADGANTKVSRAGMRPTQAIERIVTVFVAARAGDMIHGTDLVVAAEKAGLVFGDKAIFHRLVSAKAQEGPIFSMANMVKPGSFDMRHIDALQTPGVSLFMTLPGPIPALDAWDAMLPTAERLAELLDAIVLDEERNGLGRQRIAYIRDEMRDWDRKQERQRIR
ncbi:MAG TPA: cell division protein ZipA [Rudaea sp.]|nr:cell division protein ZipA [Rudaea sp.]